MLDGLHPTWQNALAQHLPPPYLASIAKAVIEADAHETVYPPAPERFAALNTTPLPNVRVVILGQDPYHGPGQAHGLAFSVPDGVPLPPSLKNIYKEIAADTGCTPPQSGNLTRLASQGVLLLNTTLTVRAREASSHSALGWNQFTDAIISAVSETQAHAVFMLWGNHAQSKGGLIDTKKHLVLTAPHPSPLSAYRGFFGSRHFSQANAYLKEHGYTPIAW